MYLLAQIRSSQKTTPNVSVGADTEQPIQKIAENSISEYEENIKSFEEMQREMQLSLDPSYLKAVSMNELFDTQYQSKPPLIDSLLYPGTYIFAGSPKLGKGFLMAQLAYHISTGTPLWNYTTRKGTVLYLALEDDYRRLQERLYRMFGTESADNLFFSVSASQLGKGLDEQFARFVAEHTDTKLIIIDTLQKVREVGGDNYSYANDYQIIIKEFYPMNLLQKLSMQKESVEDWRQLVESIYIDWNYDGQTMRPTICDIPAKDELVSGIYKIPDSAGKIKIKITDLLSESLELEV